MNFPNLGIDFTSNYNFNYNTEKFTWGKKKWKHGTAKTKSVVTLEALSIATVVEKVFEEDQKLVEKEQDKLVEVVSENCPLILDPFNSAMSTKMVELCPLARLTSSGPIVKRIVRFGLK